MLEQIFDIENFNIFSNEDEYYNLLFTYIISLKEENAKLIEKIEEF